MIATKVCATTWSDVSYSEHLCILNLPTLPTLQDRCMLLKLCLLYKSFMVMSSCLTVLLSSDIINTPQVH